MVGYNRRFSQPLLAVKEFYSERKEPLVMNYRVNAGFLPKTSWYQAADQGGRIVGEVGHFIDTMQFLTDSVPVKIYATAPADDGRQYSSDNVTVNISFADGSVGILSYLSNGANGVEKEYLEVFGEGKTAIMENFKRVVFFGGRKRRVKRFSGEKGHADEMRVCLERLRTRSPAPIGIQSLLATTQALFAINKSLMGGGVIELPYITLERAATVIAAGAARSHSE
jgi:polar amino acid transport system substrate-binding protein